MAINPALITASASKSTDKLALILDAIQDIPEIAFVRIKTFSLTWDEISENPPVIVPVIKAEFYD